MAQGLYYESHPDLRDQPQYSSERWSLQVIQVFIESALALWDARNKELHGKTPEEQRQIQKERTIEVVIQKYQEGTKNVRRRFPMLYRDPLQHLCDRSTLQLMKWLATYEECWRKLNREDTKERRRLIGIVKKGFRQKHKVPGYLRLSLFGEAKSTIIRRSTLFLANWVSKYNIAMAPRRPVHPRLDLRALKYCLPCEEVSDNLDDTRRQPDLCETSGTDRGDREGSSDLFPD